jgi:hypothetical protein
MSETESIYPPEEIVITDESSDDDDADRSDDGERLPPSASALDSQKLLRQALAILNRITDSNFEELSQRLLLLVDSPVSQTKGDSSSEVREQFVKTLIHSGRQSPLYQEIYAQLAGLLMRDLSPTIWQDPGFPQLTSGDLFQHFLVQECKTIMQNLMDDRTSHADGTRYLDAKSYSPTPSSRPLHPGPLDLGEDLRIFSRFLAILYIEEVLPWKFFNRCIRHILFSITDHSDDLHWPPVGRFEALVEVLTLVGSTLDQTPNARGSMEYYFEAIQEVLDCEQPFLGGRPRWLLLVRTSFPPLIVSLMRGTEPHI